MAGVCRKRVCVLVLLAAVGFLPSPSLGHGRLRDPPSRSSLWREDPSSPTNYNDNELNCGGFDNQWNAQDGKCGLCGDPFQGPRPNEPGTSNVYANGIISRSYTEGQIIEVKVEITANHKGWFEYRICPHNDVTTPATQSCLDQYLLPLASQPGVTRYYLPVYTAAWFNVTLKLPPGLVCDQCVFQWHYHAANSWGTDDDGQSGMGFGPQEEFRGCADVKITASEGGTEGTTTSSSNPTTATATTTTTTPTTTMTTTTPTTTTTSSGGGGGGGCIAAGAWAGDPNMDAWCVVNCAAGYCPASHCICL